MFSGDISYFFALGCLSRLQADPLVALPTTPKIDKMGIFSNLQFTQNWSIESKNNPQNTV